MDRNKQIILLLWFAFKKLYLWLDKQQVVLVPTITYSCDLLSKNCIFDLINNRAKRRWTAPGLWFAFKKLYLWLDKQRITVSRHNTNCCDLLSKNCIFDLINNYGLQVIFEFPLWFAFKKLYLWLDKQQINHTLNWLSRCDLLSKNCIFDLINNGNSCGTLKVALWFAFKKLYLWLDKQHFEKIKQLVTCCDLLSKNCIFDLINNTAGDCGTAIAVVICFQKIVSLTW